MSDIVTLPRTGNAPVRFSGELIAESDGSRTDGREQNRWHELAAYRTDGGAYVAHVAYCTRWAGERDNSRVETFASARELSRFLRDYDPASHVSGFPAGDAYAEKQARLLADVRSRFAHQVTELLEGEEFVEELTVATSKAFRFDGDTVAAIERLMSQHGYETQVGAVSHAVQSWEMALSLAIEEVSARFDRAEWNAIADACNGTMREETITGSSPATFLAAEVYDAHRLDGLGEKWFDDDGDNAIKALIAKIQSLSFVQAWTVIRAVCWFWRHASGPVDHGRDAWWTLAFRRKASKEGKS